MNAATVHGGVDGHSPNIARPVKQLLDRVFGGGRKTPLEVAVADLARPWIAGNDPSYAKAYQACKAAA